MQLEEPGHHIWLTALGQLSMSCSMTIDAQSDQVCLFIVPE